MALALGTRLGHYDVSSLIGEGGMGQVWQPPTTTLDGLTTRAPMILDRIKSIAVPGTEIPKPVSQRPYIVVGWGTSRGEEALVYRLPQRIGTANPSTKRVPASAFEEAMTMLSKTGEITHAWFAVTFPAAYADGVCNFTTLGGILELAGEAAYAGPGRYLRSRKAGRRPTTG